MIGQTEGRTDPALVTDVVTVLDKLDVPLPRIHTEQFDFV